MHSGPDFVNTSQPGEESPDDFDSRQETIYLLQPSANARRLMEAVARDKSGQGVIVKTMEELRALAGE